MVARTRTRRDEDEEYAKEEDVAPRGRRRDDDDDEDDRRPRRTTARRRDDDDEDEPPRRSRSHRDDEDDDDEPRRRPKAGSQRRRHDEDDDDEQRSRRSRRDDDDDDDADDEPRGRRPKTNTARRGWGAARQTAESTSTFAQRLTITDEPQVIKFLEDEPYGSFRRHWIERPGQKSFTCTDDESCPLCKLGERPSAVTAFNVALAQDDGSWLNKSLEVGPQLTTVIENYHKDPRTGPIDANYFTIVKTGKGKGRVTTTINPVKERDLEEDWGVLPIDRSTRKELLAHIYDASILDAASRSKLREVAAEIVGDDD